jgi:hypothetical protein
MCLNAFDLGAIPANTTLAITTKCISSLYSALRKARHLHRYNLKSLFSYLTRLQCILLLIPTDCFIHIKSSPTTAINIK